MRLMLLLLAWLAWPLHCGARLWLRFWRAVRFWYALDYSWHLAWVKAYPKATSFGARRS